MGQKKPQKVLKNLSGYALPGQTLYIMGASGAGKTSLMNALSDRIKNSAD
jgi:ABC-type multidrug transport system ATPase subunit